VDLDVVLDVDPVVAQQLTQKRHAHRLLLDEIQNRFIEVARADAVVAGKMEPVVTTQHGGDVRLADAGHAEQGNALGRPGAEGFRCKVHGVGFLEASAKPTEKPPNKKGRRDAGRHPDALTLP